MFLNRTLRVDGEMKTTVGRVLDHPLRPAKTSCTRGGGVPAAGLRGHLPALFLDRRAGCYWPVIILAPIGQAQRAANALGCVFTRLASNLGVELPECDKVRPTCAAADPALGEFSP